MSYTNPQTQAFCQWLNIKRPLIQAPMAGIQGSAMVIAVSNAGALGSLPCAMLSVEQLTQELGAIQRGTAETGAPYNLNFFCHEPPPPHVATEQRESAWRKLLTPYYAEHGIDANSIPAGAGRTPFSEACCDLIEPYKPPVVSFHFGLPEAKLVKRIQAWGGKVLSSATTVAEALWLEQHGADAIIAQGIEAGGHRGMFLLSDEITGHTGLSEPFPRNWRNELGSQMGLLSLLSQITTSVNIPVIAAGGIADSTGVQAAFTLGASAVQVGTAFMLCDEASTSPMHRAILSRNAAQPQLHHTALTTIFTGRPARGINNRLMHDIGNINAVAPPFPHATAALAPLRAAAEQAGQTDFSPLWSGQNPKGCKAIPAAQLLQEIMPM